MKIIFFGTPDFAVATLKAIIDAGFEVIAVVTAPDRPAGRNLQLKASAVKEYALEQNLNIFQPTNLKAIEFVSTLQNLNADVQVVVAFRMLPEVVWNMPPMGTYNLHASLLPHYRGAAPINHAIINGEAETGVTTFKLQHAIDTGDIALQEKIKIEDYDNASSLHDKLMLLGADLMISTLKMLENKTLVHKSQSQIEESKLKFAPKIFTDFLQIDWNKPSKEIYNFVRGLSPYPGAFTSLNGKKLKIYAVNYITDATPLPVGEFQTDGKTVLLFGTQDGVVRILELQLEGKKRMEVTEFLRGYRLT